MYTWLSRIMTFVFLFNIVVPSYAQSAQMRHKLRRDPSSLQSRMGPNERQARREADLADRVANEIKQSRAEYIQSVSPSLDAALDSFRDAVTYEEMEAAYSRLNAIRGSGSRVLNGYQDQMTEASRKSIEADNGITFGYYLDNPHVAPDAVSQTVGYDARNHINPAKVPSMAAAIGASYGYFRCPSSDEFLNMLQNNKFEDAEAILDYVDPPGFNCHDYLAVAYAAETLFYILEEFAKKDAITQSLNQEKELDVFLSHARFRAIKSLEYLEKASLSTETLSARGTLRTLISRIDQIALANNLQLVKGPTPDLKAGFLAEINALGKPKQDSAAFTQLQVAVNYAAQFATLNDDGDLLVRMVDLFENKASSKGRLTDFQNTYSPILGVIFDTVRDSYKNFRDITAQTTKTAHVFSKLIDFTGFPHGTDTRVMAIVALASLHEGPYSGNRSSDNTIVVDPQKENGTFTHNKIYLTDSERRFVASSIVELLGPLQHTHYLAMQNYGLNSDQMQELAGVLLANLQRVLPVEGRVANPPTGSEREWRSENRLITSNDFSGLEGGYIYSADKGLQLPQIYVFYNGSEYGPIEAINVRNAKKYEDEMTAKGVELFGEALFWVFGGEIIAGAFRGLRLLWGASKMLPRAIKSGRIIYNTTNGTRVYRLTAAMRRAEASLKVGSKYATDANFAAHLADHGMAIHFELDEVVVTASKPGLVKATSAVAPQAPRVIPSPIGRVNIAAAEASSGLVRTGTFNVYGGIAEWSMPMQRAQLLRFAQQQGLRNVWTAADRITFQRSLMWRNAFDKLWDGTSLHYYPGSVLAEHPALNAGLTAYGNTLRFFAGWKAGDIATGILYRDYFNRWMMRKQQEAVEAETAKHDVLSPESIEELEAQNGTAPAESSPSDILSAVGGAPKESFGWMDLLTFPSWAWQKIAPSEADAFDGSLILPPFMGGKYALSQMGIGSDPFMTDAMRAQIAVEARQVALAKARIGQVDTQLDTAVDSILAEIEQAQGEVSAMFTTLKQQFPGDWSAEEQAYRQFYNEYAAEVKELAKITNLQERSNRLTAVNTKYEQRSAELSPLIERKQNAILLANVAPEGEEAFWASYAASLQDIKGQMLFILPSDVPEAIRSSFLAEYGAIVDSALGKVRTLSQKKTAFTDKLAELERVAQEMNDKVERLSQKYSDYLTPAEPAFSDSFFSGDESQQAY